MAATNRRGLAQRARPTPVAITFLTLILTLTGPWPAAEAHGGGASARPVVKAVEPVTAGITAAAVFVGDWRIELTSTSRETVTVLDPTGRPFLRFTPSGVEADYGARAWHEGNVSAVTGRVVSRQVAPDSPPEWRPVTATPTWSWFDARIRPERELLSPQLIQANVATRLRDFEIPIRVGEQPGRITGYLEYEPRTGVYRHIMLTDSRPVAGLEVEEVLGRTVPTLTLDNQTGETITILGRDGEPFARLNGEFVEANLASPTWVEVSQSIRVVPTVKADASAPPLWRRISEGPRWSWPDYRSRPPDTELPPTTLAKGGSVMVKRWAVPLEVGSRRLEIRGLTEFVPMNTPTGSSSSRLPMATSALVAVAGAAFLVFRRRPVNAILRP
jgi:hypothetical protein